MEAQQIKTIVERALISYSGTTTSDGGAGGDTLVCTALTSQPDYNRLSVLISEGTYAGLTADIVGSTTGGTITVEPVFPGKIASGINFHIIPRLPAYSELVDIMGTGFDTATDSLVKLHDDHLAFITAAYGATEKAAIDLLDDAGYGLAALDTELGLIPQSGGTTTWNATALASINAEVDTALNTAIPGSPTADSINQRIAAIDDLTQAAGAGDLAAILGDTNELQGLIAASKIAAQVKGIDDIDLSATMKTSVNAEVDTALNTAIPGSPVADSINERIKALDDHITADYGATEKAAIDLLDDAGYGLAALDTELGLIPQSGGSTTWNATALASINAEVDGALNTAIPASPTADSINERIKTLDEAYTATRAGYLDTIPTIEGLVDSAEAAGPYSYLDAGLEQDVVEDTATTRRRIWLEFSNRNMTQTGTFKIYRKVDGTNYDLWATVEATVAAGADRAWDAEFTTNQAWKLTYEEGADEGADRDIPYNVITQVIE